MEFTSNYSDVEIILTLNDSKSSSVYDLNHSDTTWILLCAFTIFTMQIGFGLFEAGMISKKNQVNIMMKNGIDLVLGGVTFWIIGFGILYGQGEGTNPFIAVGEYFFDPKIDDSFMGGKYTAFLFQLSFATTATTIVSGAMAERTNFMAYCVFSMLNTVNYCISAGWVWGSHGFLYDLGVVDIAGSGPIHLFGGAAAFMAACMLGPRQGRYKNGTKPPPPGSPMMVCHGFFLLWFGWLSFNSGSTFGVTGESWKYCARAAVMTMLGAFGAGSMSLIISMTFNKGKMEMMDLINGVFGGLVGITAGCFVYSSTSAFIVGAIGAALVLLFAPLIDRVVDDPVGASAVHGVGGMWGVIAVGLFAEAVPLGTTNMRSGLFLGGGWYLLGVQALTVLLLAVWGIVSTFLMLFTLNQVIPVRMHPQEEAIGADLSEHNIEVPKCGCNCSQRQNIIPHVNGRDNFGYQK